MKLVFIIVLVILLLVIICELFVMRSNIRSLQDDIDQEEFIKKVKK